MFKVNATNRHGQYTVHTEWNSRDEALASGQRLANDCQIAVTITEGVRRIASLYPTN